MFLRAQIGAPQSRIRFVGFSLRAIRGAMVAATNSHTLDWSAGLGTPTPGLAQG